MYYNPTIPLPALASSSFTRFTSMLILCLSSCALLFSFSSMCLDIFFASFSLSSRPLFTLAWERENRAMAWQNQQNDMCAQQRLRSVCPIFSTTVQQCKIFLRVLFDFGRNYRISAILISQYISYQTVQTHMYKLVQTRSNVLFG